ncbi:MAG: hypothetical protein V1767_09720 [Chloroflexota bacterium]
MAVKINKDIARQWLADVPEEKRFWCSNGKILKNLAELESALNEMSEETYIYHANAYKADFSNWVKDVIGDEVLAGFLLRSISKSEAAGRVMDRITFLNRKIKGK